MLRLLSLFFVLSVLFGCKSSKESTLVPQKASSAFNEKKDVLFGRTYLEAAKQKVLNNFEQAEKGFKAALAIKPNHAAANYELGLIYSVQERYDEAYERFKIASKQEPSNYWYKRSYAHLLQRQNKISDAINEYKELIELKPKESELKYELSKLYINNGEKEEGIRYLNLIEEEIGVNEEISYLKQRIYLSMNDVDGAINEIQQLVDHFPNEIRYQGILAEIYLSNNRKDEALKVYEQMNAKQTNNYQAQFALAAFYRSEGDHDNYLKNIQQAFSNPEMNIDDKVKYILSSYQVDSKNEESKKEVIALCKKITEAHPDDAKSHALLADFLYFDDQITEAKESYFRTLALDSSRFPVWNQLLIILSDDNDIPNLLNYGQRAVDLFPNQPTVYLLYGLGLARDNQHAQAIEYYELGKDLVIDNPSLKSQMYSSIGDSHHELKNHGLSDKAYDYALQLDPNNVLVLNNYAYYLSVRKEQLEKAKKMSAKSNNLAPNQASFQDTYAWILFQLEDYETASIWIDKALESDSNPSGEVLEHKGDIYFKKGDIKTAVEFWEKAKNKGGTSSLIDKKIKDQQYYE